MSEKKLREWIESGEGTIVLCPPETACASCQELYDAVAADPDVVEMLRELEQTFQAWRFRDVTEFYDAMRQYLEEKFHVRLTEDGGYKWVEEATEQGDTE